LTVNHLKPRLCILFLAGLLLGCARDDAATVTSTPLAPGTPTEEPAATATAESATEAATVTAVVPTATSTATVVSPTPETTPETEMPTAEEAPVMTVTPYPGATPTPGPLNTPVPTASTGEYACGEYPCFDDAAAWEARIHVPPGFTVRYYAQVEPHPTSFTFGPQGLLYVARQEGEIVTVDEQGTVRPYAGGFYHLVSLAFRPGTDRLYAASRAESNESAILWLIEDGRPRPLIEDLPCCYGGWHQANGIAFGPDGYGYVSVGARSDHGERHPLHPLEASVLRFSPDGSDVQVFARGLRNTFDIAWDGSGRLFGADNMPDHGPPEEFNRIEPGGHHGFPYYDCAGCSQPPADLQIVPPLHELVAHSGPTGVTADLAEQFPGYYNNLFLALWSAFPGAQKIVRFGPHGQDMTDFATGFAAPVDVTVGPRGSLFVVDWATGVIFQIAYEGS
jgi:glucose/arabinose dehydrogenase